MLIKKLFTFLIFLGTAVLLGGVLLYYESTYITKLFYTFIALASFYLFFEILLERLFGSKIKNTRSRYSFRKTVHILFLVISFVVILRIWIIDPQALFVAYGLIAAGVAIALQDLFRNFAGGIIIFLSSPYQVGDRVEINGKRGDVIDIGIMYTTLLEICEWVDGDQATGRLTTLPNGAVLSGSVHNYTKSHDFIWDEISLPITYNSDWKKAMNIMRDVVQKEANHYLETAQKQFSRLEENYYVSKRNTEVSVYITMTDNWIQMNVRYVVDARMRRVVRGEIMKKMLTAFESESNIAVSSTTITLVDAKSGASDHSEKESQEVG